MSTANFAKCNTGKIYAFGSNVYATKEMIELNGWQGIIDEDDFLEDETRLNYEDTLDWVVNELTERLGWDEDNEYDGDRNYCGHYFAQKERQFDYCGIRFEICVRAKTVSGYYEGATFDFDSCVRMYNLENKCFYYEEIASFDLEGYYAFEQRDVVDTNLCGNVGLSKIHAKGIYDRVMSERKKIVDELERVYAEHCEHELLCVGFFSNGEAVYEDANSKRAALKAACMSL